MVKIHKRSYLLLEVLISIAIVVMCIIPLIYPHTYILKSQKLFIEKVRLDHDVNLLFTELLERLYQNEIPWSAIENKTLFDVDENLLRRAGISENFPFKGTYQLSDIIHKPKDDSQYKHYLIKLEFVFVPNFSKEKGLSFTYEIFVVRNLGLGATEQVGNASI